MAKAQFHRHQKVWVESVGAWANIERIIPIWAKGARNKWQPPEDCGHHPHPGTFPVVVTDANDWGGWRVPGAEYDRDPYRIEYQARLLACAPKLMRLARELTAQASDAPEECSSELLNLARYAKQVLRFVNDEQSGPAMAMAAE